MEDKVSLDQVSQAIKKNPKYSEFYSFEENGTNQAVAGDFLPEKEYHKTIAQLNSNKLLNVFLLQH